MPYSNNIKSDRELDSISKKPTVIDDLLSDYYDIDISINPTYNSVQRENGGLMIYLKKGGFITSLLKPKSERIEHKMYDNTITYEFVVKFMPNRKYVQHLEGVYKLVPYNMSIPTLSTDYFHSVYLYFNDNHNEFLSVIQQPKFDEKLKSYLYEYVKNNTTIFQSDKMYKRVVDEIGKKIASSNTTYLFSDFENNGLKNHLDDQNKIRINPVEWKVKDIYNSFLNDLKSGELPISFKYYVGIEEDELVG